MTALSLVLKIFRGRSLPMERVTIDFGHSVMSLETGLS